jgi:glycosyltransferase involved in cell wall biosynthesis
MMHDMSSILCDIEVESRQENRLCFLRKPRVTVFNTQPPHLYVGGVERRIIEVGRELANTVNTTVYSGTKNGFKEPVSRGGISLVPCASTDKFFPIDNWTYSRTVSGMTNEIEADIFESHNVSGHGFLRTLKKRNMTSRLIQVVHGPLMDEYVQAKKYTSKTLRNWLNNKVMWYLARVEKKLAEEAELVVTVSSYSLKKIVQHYDVDPQKIRIVPNGVNCSKFRPFKTQDSVRNRRGIKKDEKYVLFVGRLVPRKGLSYLVEAAEEIVKEQKNVKFVLVGDGPLRNKLTKELQEKGLLEHFEFLGDVWSEDVPRIYNCADVFVFPSIQEGQGIALLEAQATAKPVVAFNVAAVKEVVKDKETGFLVEPDSKLLADAALNLLSDESLRHKMGHAGREFVRNNFSWKKCADKMLDVYQEVTC